jgi:hypothetical protein
MLSSLVTMRAALQWSYEIIFFHHLTFECQQIYKYFLQKYSQVLLVLGYTGEKSYMEVAREIICRILGIKCNLVNKISGVQILHSAKGFSCTARASAQKYPEVVRYIGVHERTHRKTSR